MGNTVSHDKSNVPRGGTVTISMRAHVSHLRGVELFDELPLPIACSRWQNFFATPNYGVRELDSGKSAFQRHRGIEIRVFFLHRFPVI